RGELRGCLSKARRLLDGPNHPRIQSDGGNVRLDLHDCDVDVVAIDRQMQVGLDTLETEGLRFMLSRFIGDFLDGLEIGRNPLFNSWLIAQRRHYRAYRMALLEQLVA